MKRVALAIVSSVLIAGSASAQSFFERVGINSVFGISPSTQDFVTQAALGEIFQVEISELARHRGSSASKRFAAKMLEEHRATSSQLKRLVDSGSVRVTFPTALNSAYQARLDKLKNVRDADFDKEFDRTQIDLHKEMISLFERYGRGGSHPDLKRFAYRPKLP
jgi:putative membrane protein